MHTLVPGHIVVTATGAIYSSSVFSYAAIDPTTDYQIADDLSFIKGNHQIAFGGNWIRSVQNVYGPLNGDGNFTFNGQATGLSMADFLIGYVSSLHPEAAFSTTTNATTTSACTRRTTGR